MVSEKVPFSSDLQHRQLFEKAPVCSVAIINNSRSKNKYYKNNREYMNMET